MTTPAQFAVSEGGAATYTVPIQVPPGIANMEPKLALSYSSQAGNGLMGLGWSLSGLSSISRCPQTLQQDGARSVVNLTTSDRFCLDGQRLFKVNPLGQSIGNVNADYLASGSEYRTENDSFSKIVLNADSNSFTVYTKSGLIMEYGTTADSKVQFTGKSSPHAWALRKVSDVTKNFMTMEYADNNNGNFRPVRVNYTGNVGQAPSNKVELEYADGRLDISSGYSLGVSNSLIKRLTSVSTYAGSSLVKKYSLAYNPQASAIDKSKLISVQECDGAGMCLPSIETAWALLVSAQSATTKMLRIADFGTSTGWTDNSFFSRMLVDVNGDGLPDIVGFKGDRVYVSLNTGGGFAEAQIKLSNFGSNAGGWADSNLYPKQLIDVNGDGLPDIVVFASDGVYAFLNNGDGFSPGQRKIADFGIDAGWSDNNLFPRMLVDVNGDGLPDIVGFKEDGVYVSLNIAGEFGPKYIKLADFGSNNGWSNSSFHPRQLVDVNGDGLPDIVGFANGGGVYVSINTGNGFDPKSKWVSEVPVWSDTSNSVSTSGGWTNNNSFPRMLVDVNGDGLPDIVGFGRDGVYVYLNTGSSFAARSMWIADFGTSAGGWTDTNVYPRQLADVNGDGLPDIVGFASDGVYVSLNTGSGFAAKQLKIADFGVNAGWSNSNLYPRQLADVNGDGLPYVVGFKNDGFYVAGNTLATQSNYVSTFKTGLTNATSVNFQTLTTASLYSKDIDSNKAVYPKVDIIAPMQVVSSVTSSNGIGGTNSVNYQYGGLKAQAGRGMLGFRWIKVKEAATGIETYTEYRQDWPYIGMAAKSETRLAGAGNGGLLKQTTSTPGCKVPATGADCALPPDNCVKTENIEQCKNSAQNRRFIYTASSSEASWDLNGTAFPTSTSTTTYGINAGDNQLFGDPQTITVTNSGGGVKTTINTYLPANTAKWILGRLSSAQVTSSAPDTRVSVGGNNGATPTASAPSAPLDAAANSTLINLIMNILDDDD